MKIVFIYWGPHPLHLDWAKQITKDIYFFIPKFFERFRTKSAILHQFLSIIKSIKIPKADVYLIEGMVCALPAIIRKRENSKIIMINSDTFFYDYRKIKGLKKKIYARYLKSIDGIISTSNYIKRLADECIKIPNIVAYPGIDKRFLKVNADLNSANIAHGMTRLSTHKGTDLMIRSFLRLNDKNKLYLIGPVDEKMEILEKNKQNKNIIITGWTDHPERYLKKCCLYVNPARHEPFGINILEAMAAGVPPIVSKYCGAKELVEKVSKELMIEPEVDEIVKKIKWLQSDLKRKKELGKKCKEVAKNHTLERSIKEFKDKFYKLLEEIKK